MNLYLLFRNGTSKMTCLQDQTEFLPNEVRSNIFNHPNNLILAHAS